MLKWLSAKKAPAIDPARLIEEGLAFQREGRFVEARERYATILGAMPDHFDALFLTGLTHQSEGDQVQAIAAFDRAIAVNGDDAEVRSALAASFRLMQRWPEALTAYRAALDRAPERAEWWNDFGTALLDCGRHGDALAPLLEAARLDPERADIRFNLGNAWRIAGQLREAVAEYRECVARDPAFLSAWNNLGIAHHSLAQFGQAIECFERVVALAPDYADGVNNLGSALQGAGRPQEAISRFRRAIELDPRHPHASRNLAQALQELGSYAEAVAAYEDALARAPGEALRVRAATVLPVVPDSTEAIAAARQHLLDSVTALTERGVTLPNPERDIATVNFHLAYHGLNDRPIQQALSRLYLKACRSLGWERPAATRRGGERLRVGFVTRFLHDHSIGKTSRGLIAQLDRERFEVFSIHVPPVRDDTMARWIRAHSDHNLDLPTDIQPAREAIAALDLDVLFFQEIGMDAYTYFLAYARLAPVQCVSFGHPDTTGIPNMDWWVSSANFEPPDPSGHYSERLWQAQGIGTLAYYYRPQQPDDWPGRREFGLPEDRPLFFCPHSVFRLHPEFDAYLAGILEADPRAEILLLEGTQPAWVERFLARLARTAGPAMNRIRVLPLQRHERFLALMRAVDAVLDPICFNGMNNSLDAFSVGTPVVTFPHLFQRGRHTYGMYRHMGWTGCVAESRDHYIEIATRLGREPDFRAEASREIVARSAALYEDPQVVREFERFFQNAVAQARQ